jgi:DNA invertase Pin-like site-specific DNA recombinase
MAKVTIIPSKINPITHQHLDVKVKRRVAAYARVSTDDEMQLTSYEAQVDYYTKLIKANDEWEFVKVYADEGITGTSLKNRKEFNAMIKDALDDKIDLIITKSVSRFARNTVDALTTIRKLKEKRKEIYFEKENIYTLDSKGEVLVTIMSSLAQDESRNISENVTWGQRKRFSDGKYNLARKNFLGYKKDQDGNIVIDEKEALVVKKIYRYFLDGMTPGGIAQSLMEEGVPTPGGKTKWIYSTITSILQNEKYKGDALLQKRFTVNFLEHKMKKNEGEVNQYYVKNGHPAIIDPLIWDRVQLEIKRREMDKNVYSAKDVFSSKLKCAECGSYYGKKVWHSNDPYRKVIWRCNHKYDGAKKCDTPTLEEDTIKDAFLVAYNNICVNKEMVIETTKELVESLCDFEDLDNKIIKESEDLDLIADKVHKMVMENASTAQDQEEYQKRYDYLSNKYDEGKAKVKALQEERARRATQKEILELKIKELETADILKEWNESVFKMSVDEILVSKEELTFKFYIGDEIKIKL